MNKLLKGAVAGAAGIALLLGGAGTFALWNTSATVNVGTVASGTLKFAQVGAPSWRNIASDVPSEKQAISDIVSYRIVPGDKLELTEVVAIDATGDNLHATLSLDDASITGPLKTSLSPITMTATGASVTAGATPNTFNVSPVNSVAESGATTNVTITVIVELPASVSGTTAQGSSLDLSNLSFKLQQNAR